MGVRELLGRDSTAGCDCSVAVETDAVTVDGDDCSPGSPRAAPACRAAVVRALRGRTVDRLLVRRRGTERRNDGAGLALLVAASRFRERVRDRSDRLASRAARDPLAAAEAAGGRAGPVATAAAESGLLAAARDVEGYDRGLAGVVGPTIARSRVDPRPPAGGRLEAVAELATGATARIYAVPGRELRTYHLSVPSQELSADDRAALARARRRRAAPGALETPRRAVGAVAGPAITADLATLADLLRKHTTGDGLLEDCFADPAVTDVFAGAPAAASPLRVKRDGETLRTNVRLTPDGASAIASRLRRTSGDAFSRATPTIDAVTTVPERGRIRAAGLTAPASEGYGFAFRAHERTAWTLPGLVANGTLSGRTAGLLSLAVERAAAMLVAGPRGAGKTTLLGALLWELPAATRLVAIEDTPELPLDALRDAGRDVQGIRTAPGEGPGLAPGAALRSALRLGDGALVVGEVRGEEAQVLYEAMRVGAGGSAVMGTVHGADGPAVRDRLVSELDVPAASFGATDLVVSLAPAGSGDDADRGVAALEEVLDDGGAGCFASIGPGPERDRLDRGNSELLATVAAPEESYAEVLDAVADRAAAISRLADDGRTGPEAVVSAHAQRRTAGAGDSSDDAVGRSSPEGAA